MSHQQAPRADPATADVAYVWRRFPYSRETPPGADRWELFTAEDWAHYAGERGKIVDLSGDTPLPKLTAVTTAILQTPVSLTPGPAATAGFAQPATAPEPLGKPVGALAYEVIEVEIPTYEVRFTTEPLPAQA